MATHEDGGGQAPGQRARPGKAPPWLRPALRPEVQLAADPPRLLDRATGAELRLAAHQAPIVRAFDGRADLARLSRRTGAAAAEVEALVRTLLYTGLLRGAPDPGRDVARRARAEPERFVAEAPLEVADGTRFECQACGTCCRSYTLGPVLPEEAERIRALPLAEAFPHLAGRDPFRPGPTLGEQQQTLLLATRQDTRGRHGCVFLDEATNLCGLHARFGADAKPLACRVFPFGALRTASGITIYDRGECASYGTSAFAGAPLADQLADPAAPAASLLRRAAKRLTHTPVVLGKGLTIGHALFEPVERRLAALVREAGDTIADALGAVGHALALLVRAVREAPLDADPRRVVERFATAPAGAFGPRTRGSQSLGAPAARARLHAALAEAARRLAAPGGQRVFGAERFYEDALPAFARIADAAARAAAAAATDPAPSAPAAARAPLARPEIDRHLRALTAQLIFGKALLGVDAAPLLGLAWVALVLDLILAGATAARDDAAPGPAALTAAQVTVLVAMRDRELGAVLLRQQPDCRALLASIGAPS